MKFKIIAIALTSLFAAQGVAQDVDGQDLGGGWKLDIETDSMTDHKIVRLIKAQENAVIAFKCDRAAPESVYLHLIGSDYIGEQRRSRTRNMKVRFDDKPPLDVGMRTDRRSAMIFQFRDVQAIARKSQAAEQLKFRVFGYDSRSHDFSFDVSQAAGPLERLFVECLSEL